MTTPLRGEGLIAEPVADRILVPTMFLVFAVAVANTTSGAIAQPAIADAFGAGAADVGAIVFGYSTTFAIMTAVYGSLARRFGLARCLTLGVFLVAVGAGIAVVSVNLPMLVAARVLQGFGAGAIPTLTMALISHRLQGPARARALGINVAAVGVGFAAGPLVGGLLLEAFGWRGAMALGLFVAPAALVIPRLDREPGRPDVPIDVLGMVLLAIAVGGLVLVINRLPVMGLGLPLLVIACVSAVAGAVLVRRSRGRPGAALPLRELGDGVLRRMMLLGYVGQTAFFGVLILAPIIAARIHGLDGFSLGLLLAPMAILIAVVSPRNGQVTARIGRRATTTASLAIIGLACTFLGLVGPAAPLPLLAVGLVFAGGGFGLLSAPLVGEVSRRFGDDRRSLALGMYNLAFFLGSASGGAIATGFVQAGIDVGPLAGRPLAGASTGLLLLAAMPLAFLVFDRLRPSESARGVVPATGD